MFTFFFVASKYIIKWGRSMHVMAEQENRKKVFIYLVITRWRYPGGKRHLFEGLDARFRDGFHADQTGEQRGSGERKQRDSREKAERTGT
jgi:hypothetical protein